MAVVRLEVAEKLSEDMQAFFARNSTDHSGSDFPDKDADEAVIYFCN